MIAVLQRVTHASVTIDQELKANIKAGLLILLGITHQDTENDIQYLVKKIAKLRIFGDAEGKMNLSVLDIKGEILVVSQFTLFANTQKGNRPSFTEAAPPSIAIPLYEKFIEKLNAEVGFEIKTGTFGADMKVELLNDGPVTIILDSLEFKV